MHRRKKELTPAEKGAYTIGKRNLHCTSKRPVQAAQAVCAHGERRWGHYMFMLKYGEVPSFSDLFLDRSRYLPVQEAPAMTRRHA